MKIAVTSQNRKTVTEHAGRCRKFWVFVIENNQIVSRELLELPKEQAFHEISSKESHPLDGVELLISASIGPGLMARLERKGAKGLVTKETDPEKAVLDYLNGLPYSMPSKKGVV